MPSEMSTIFSEHGLVIRTHDDHIRKCDMLDAAATQRDRDKLSVNYGINSRSRLDELNYFNVCSGALVQDVMHDVLEGIVCLCNVKFSLARFFFKLYIRREGREGSKLGVAKNK